MIDWEDLEILTESLLSYHEVHPFLKLVRLTILTISFLRVVKQEEK